MKGTWKEGTDMDAFNDNVPAVDDANANVTNSNSSANDNCNATPVPIKSNVVPVPFSDSNKRTESNDTTVTIKSEVKVPPKSKVDVTAIVKDVPKSAKVFAAVESQDETDRAVNLTNEKLVQAKNEVNAKSNTENNENSNIIDSRLNLPYKEGKNHIKSACI